MVFVDQLKPETSSTLASVLRVMRKHSAPHRRRDANLWRGIRGYASAYTRM